METYTKVKVDVQGNAMECLKFEPDGNSACPGVIVMQHIPISHEGLEKDPFTINIGERFAKAGYVAVIPYIFHWWSPEVDIATKREQWRDDRLLADLDAAHDVLKGIERVDPVRLAVMGHCWGGRMAWLSAGSRPGYKVAGVLYGGRIKVAMGEGAVPPVELTSNMTCDMIGIFGNDDQNPSPEDVKDLNDALDVAGVAHEFHCYDDAGHGFQDFMNEERYRQEASDDAWRKLMNYFDARLK